MNDLLKRFHAWFDPIALRVLNWLNGAAAFLITVLAAFIAARPNFAAEITAALNLSPLQGMLVGMAWCAVVAYVVKRAKAA
jgi:hypothetical protein